MARTTKKDLEEIISKQNEQIQMMTSFMELLAKNQGIELPENLISLKEKETKNEVKETTSENPQTKTVRAKRVRKPVQKEVQDKLDAVTGVTEANPSAIDLLSTELNNVREIKEEVALRQNASFEDSTQIENTTINNNQSSEADFVLEKEKDNNFSKPVAKGFAYTLGTFVGKAVAAIKINNFAERLSQHREKYKSQYNDNERRGFDDEVVVDTSSNPTMVESVEKTLKEQALKVNAKMNVVKNGITNIYSFVSNTLGGSKEKTEAKLADAARKVFVAAGVKVEHNANNVSRKQFLDTLGHTNVVDYIRINSDKDIQKGLDIANHDLSERGYTKTEMGFMHSSLAQVAREHGADVVANHIIRNVIPDLNKKIGGAMELYGDLRKVIAKDSDFTTIASIIKKNKLDMTVEDFMATVKEDKNVFEPLHKFGNVKLPNKLKNRLGEIVEKHESYQAKISNIFAGLSVYIETAEAHRRVIAGLDIDDKFKENAFEFINDTKYNMSKKSQPSFAQISEIIKPYVAREKALLKEEQEKNTPVQEVTNEVEVAKQKALDAIAKAKSVISDLNEDASDKKVTKPRAPRRPRDPNAPPKTRKKSTPVTGADNVSENVEQVKEGVSEVSGEIKNNQNTGEQSNKVFMPGKVMDNIQKTVSNREEEVSSVKKSRTP